MNRRLSELIYKLTTKDKRPPDFWLRLIIAEKLAEVIILFTLSLSLVPGISPRTFTIIRHFSRQTHFISNVHFITGIISGLTSASHERLELYSTVFLSWGLLELVESVGLISRQIWGEYFIVVVTILFIPVELFMIVLHPSFERLTVMAFNIFLVVYLARSRGLFRSSIN